jgi:Ni/Co efflux regulator RcnB
MRAPWSLPNVRLNFIIHGIDSMENDHDASGGRSGWRSRSVSLWSGRYSRPKGWRITEPHGWNARPTTVDRTPYQHNFQAARSFRIRPYHRPAGWSAHRWGYGEILPRAYWAAPYVIGDYWLFALEVPPAGYEWVRDGNDALLIDTARGEILQVEYGVFA